MLVVAFLGLARLSFAAGVDNPLKGVDSLETLITNIIKYALGLTAVLAVGFIVYGGFLYISSQGEPKQLEAGKQAIIGAVIGIVVIGLAYAIVEFVVNAMGAGGSSGGTNGISG